VRKVQVLRAELAVFCRIKSTHDFVINYHGITNFDLYWSLDEKIDAEFLGLNSGGQIRIALYS